MARPSAPTIPLKMYRHFAVLTLALTSAIALFADGESRAAVAERIEQDQRETALRRESQARFGAPRVGGAQPAAVGEFDDDPPVRDFGAPMDRPGGVGGGSASTSAIMPASGIEQLGYSQEYLDSLSPEERELLLSGLAQNGLLSDDAREQRVDAIEAASARRSGSASQFE